MTITWTKIVLPSGKAFAGELYDFLTIFESVSLNPYPIGKHKNITIGVGFDLRARGDAVQNAVFEAMGFDKNVVAATSKPSNISEQKDYEYIQQLRGAVAEGGEAGIAKFNSVMEARAKYYSDNLKTDPAYVAYINSVDANGPQNTFGFSSDNVVESVFNCRIPGDYRGVS
jgi:hypothetical protein